MSDCDIPNKCPFCGEHTYCVNARPRPDLETEAYAALRERVVELEEMMGQIALILRRDIT